MRPPVRRSGNYHSLAGVQEVNASGLQAPGRQARSAGLLARSFAREVRGCGGLFDVRLRAGSESCYGAGSRGRLNTLYSEIPALSAPTTASNHGVVILLPVLNERARSEERRVGKECRSRW